MKTFAFALILTAGVTALPELGDVEQRSNERFVAGIVTDAIEKLSKDLKEKGLDPYINEGASYKFKLPVTDIFEFKAFVENILVKGISNIKINSVNYSVFSSRLRIDLSLPLIHGSIKSSEANVKLFDHRLGAKLSGSLAIEEIRLHLDIRLYIGIISGVSVRSLAADFSLHKINSNLNVKVAGHDFSRPLNTYLSKTLPNILKENSDDINKLLAHYLKQIIEQAL